MLKKAQHAVGGEAVELTRLDNGVEILSLALPHTQSVAFGFWIENGSRYQTAAEDGFAHLLEHMLFKGTPRYSAADLSAAMEPLGGNINAFTDRELTAYHATVLGEDLAEAFALMQEMVLHSHLSADELRLEKSVVAQEVAMVAEDPEDWVQEQLSRRIWGDDPLGWPILGRSSVIRRASRRRLLDYYRRHYVGSRIKIVAAGRVAHDGLVALASRELGDLPRGEGVPPCVPPVFQVGEQVQHRHTFQAHLAWAAEGFAVGTPDYYRASLANLILGGSSGSRLFRQIRERLGLAYSVYSHLEFYRDTGEWRLYAGTERSEWRRCAAEVEQVLAELAAQGPAPEELERGRRHLRAQLLMSLEDVEVRMTRLARQWIYLGRLVPVEESLDALAAVDAEGVRSLVEDRWGRRYRFLCLPEKGGAA
ncbi:MAG: M16 family metallopeptidase [Pseudomonadota bacterium]